MSLAVRGDPGGHEGAPPGVGACVAGGLVLVSIQSGVDDPYEAAFE